MKDNQGRQTAEIVRLSEARYRTLFDSIDEGFCICEMLLDDQGQPCDYRFLEVNPMFEVHTGLHDAVGKTALEMIPGLEMSWIETYGQVALTGQPLRFTQGSGAMGRWFDVYAFPFGESDQHQFAILFTNITARKQAEERQQLQQSLALTLASALTLPEAIDGIMQHLVSDLTACLGFVALFNGQQQLEIAGARGYGEPEKKLGRLIPLDTPSPVARAVRKKTPQWRHSPSPLGAEPAQSWAVLPLTISDQVIGVISLGFSEPRALSEVERGFLITLAAYCAQVIKRIQLTEQLRQLAADEERQRISRDLHDSVQQILFASSIRANALPNVWARDPEKGKKQTQELGTLNKAALAEMRTLLYEMRPEALVKSPFETLLENLGEALQGRRFIIFNFTYDGPEELRLPPDVHVALYRLAQEALHNVAKHSRASQVDLTCAYRAGRLHLTIRDNGRGFDVAQTAAGIGLNTMRERTESVGATLTISSTPGAGTEIHVRWQTL